MATPKPLPIWLQRTPEQVARDEQLQIERRASFGRVKMTDEERMIARGAQLEEAGRLNLETAEGDYERLVSEAIAEGNELEPAQVRDLVQTMRHAQSQLAEGMAMQGKYKRAAKAHPDPNRSLYFKRITEAIDRDDEEDCKCKGTWAEIYRDEKGEFKAQRLKKDEKPSRKGQVIETIPRQSLARIYSPKHKRVVDLELCVMCGKLNARPLLGALRKQRDARAKGSTLTDVQMLGVR